VLSTFFFLLTLLAYVNYVQKVGSPDQASEPAEHSKRETAGGRFYYFLTLVFFGLGLLSKPMLVTLPFVLLLVDYWPLKRLRIGGQQLRALFLLLREKFALFALSIIFSIVTFVVQKQAGAMQLMQSIPLKLRLANAAVSYARYLLKTIWPIDLAAFYPIPREWPTWQVALSVLILLLGSVLALASLRKRPYLAMGWFWFLGTLVPVIGIVQVGTQSMADRYTYIPLIGILITLAFGLNDLVRSQPEWRQGLSAIAAMAVALCAVLSAIQARYWSDTATLFEHTLAVTQNNAIAEYQVGVARARVGNYQAAYPHFVEALRIQPDYGAAYNNLGLLLVMDGKVDEGIAHYRQALQAGADTPEVHLNLGLALMARGALDEAAAECTAALKAKPSFSAARVKLATILEGQGQHDKARQEYEAVLALDSGNADAHLGLAMELARESKPAEALKHFQVALRIRPNAQTQYTVALFLSLQGRAGEALAYYREAVRLQPSWPAALNDLAWILATDPIPEHRNGEESVKLAEKACSLTQRKDPRCLGTLDACYAEAGQFDQAIATAREAQALALSCGQKEVADAAAERCKLYESRKPYRQASATK
jgi:tetratricopeptide (TPR) repeat protein